MTYRSIIVADGDVERLRRLVRALKYSLFRDQTQLELLDQALESAEVKPPGRVPRDVVRMNSRVRVLDFDTRSRGCIRWFFLRRQTSREASFQFLRRWGIALIGRRRGDIIEAKVPGGIRRLRVEHVWHGPEITRKRVPDRSVEENFIRVNQFKAPLRPPSLYVPSSNHARQDSNLD